ncbi:MAG: HAD hydrolase family protein [Candidatus Woesearchaeota archaeon]
METLINIQIKHEHMREHINKFIQVLEDNKLDESLGISWHTHERKKRLKKIILTMHRVSKLKPDFETDLRFLMDILAVYDGKKESSWLKQLPQSETVRKVNLMLESTVKQLKQILLARLEIGVVFSDIDNTIIHKEKAGNCIRIADEERFISKKSIKNIAKIMQFVPVVLISGRRLKSFKRVTHRIPYTFGIIEHGCMILEEGNIDKDYLEIMRPYIGCAEEGKKEGVLWEYERFFQDKGYKTDSEGRLASFRIDPETNNLTEEQIQEIEMMEHPKGITTTRNLSFLDFMPAIGGKENAIRFILNKKGLGWHHAACMGDDTNDIKMLSQSGYPFTLSGAKAEIIDRVRKKGGYVSQFRSHKGTEDMLSRIHDIVRVQSG